jgi:GT2 family glycosyltransferase/glycosyltransferase involved in cell wall biosynthesis
MTTPPPNHQSLSGSPGSGPLGTILLDWRRQQAGQPLLLLQDGLAAPAELGTALLELLAQLEANVDGPVVLTVLSNALPELNPFAGIGAERAAAEPGVLADLVTLLGPGLVHDWVRWPPHLALLSAGAVEALAQPDTTSGNALNRLRQAGGRLLLPDTLYLHDPRRDLAPHSDLQPHEERRPPAWGALSERLERWLRQAAPADQAGRAAALRRAASAGAATLHVTHSWGGGVARWTESFIEADETGLNFQLRSEAPESGAGCGQRLSLYLGNQLETPVASWWLQPPILSSAEQHPAYRAVLREVLERYGVGRVIVSSLVGHSLDALASGLPTLQVLHDYYPRWPLLGVNPAPYLEESQAVSLRKPLQDHPLQPELGDHDAAAWETLGERWREAVERWGVRMVAPSRSVVELLRRLDPAWSAIDIEILPHGLPPLPGTAEIVPRDRPDGRLRLVIPGRIQEGKGQRLLLQALPELGRYARVCLLGAGPSGEVFFGHPDVDVIIHYRREELRELLAAIGPHVAGLLSIVPETFSYTLSEMQQLRVPVVATRVGSLAERISDGESGWLIEPDPAALVARIRDLAADRGQIERVRQHLQSFDLQDARRMVKRYDDLCQTRPASRSVTRFADGASLQAAARAFQNQALAANNRELAQRAEALQAEVEKRTAWAEEREQARQQEEERRVRWVAELEQQLETRFAEVQAARSAFENEAQQHRQSREQLHALEAAHDTLQTEHNHLRAEHDFLSGEHARLQAEHDWALATRSWRYTRPFRVAGRIFTNLGQAGAWNPLRWPLLLGQSARTLRTRGLRGALLRAQRQQQRFIPESLAIDTVETVGDPDTPTRIPRSEDPEVSIVIPVYNKWAYTAACLRSLADTSCRAGFEVIVVDDLSTDVTPQRLAAVEGLVSLRNEQNLGFVGSCNRGAEQARGRYIVMLNNDTQVMNGWLDALLETFERFPDTGLAGARLVYPDGTLQEAGGIIFRDGSGWNYGKGDSADRPEYQFSREVDYCSGACIMLPTSLFRELGGFDPHYAPAYYEDTDLAFRIRQRGLRVRLQAAATIVHHEGVTSGTDIGSGTKRYQAVNREKFLQRWQAELAQFPAPIVDPDDRGEIRRARDHRLRGRVLVVDAYTPEPDQDSGSLRLRYLMSCLQDLGYGVTFLPDNRAHAGRYTSDLQAAGIEAVYGPWADSLQRFFAERGGEFDFVMISRHYVASRYLPLLKRHCPRARVIFDTVDLHYLREERLAKLENSASLARTAAQTRRSELAVIAAADATLVVSPVEQSVLREAAPKARVHVISNVHEIVGSRCPFRERQDLFFVGGYQHPPNIDAARWFVGSIWPLIREELPDARFHLVGSKAPDEVRALHGNGVVFHGFVENIEPFLDGCRIAVAPLRYGAGVKGKVNMSMSRGQPVVATPMAVEGMFAKAGRDVMVAETAADFAAAVVQLYRDEALWNRVSAGGLENVQKYFSVETARLGLRELLDSLGRTRDSAAERPPTGA